MKLSELQLHCQMMMNLCRDKGIDPNIVEVYYVSDVLWRSGHVEESEKLLKNKKPITSIEMDALQRKELLLYDSAAWDQLNRARGVKP